MWGHYNSDNFELIVAPQVFWLSPKKNLTGFQKAGMLQKYKKFLALFKLRKKKRALTQTIGLECVVHVVLSRSKPSGIKNDDK